MSSRSSSARAAGSCEQAMERGPYYRLVTWRRPPFLLLAAGWLTLPFTADVALSHLLDAPPATRGGRVVAWVLAGIVYGAGVLGLFHPGAPGLFALRLGTVGVFLGVAVPAGF